jgi:hypothetical protein
MLRAHIVGLAPRAPAACSSVLGGAGGGAVIAELEPLSPENDNHSRMPQECR